MNEDLEERVRVAEFGAGICRENFWRYLREFRAMVDRMYRLADEIDTEMRTETDPVRAQMQLEAVQRIRSAVSEGLLDEFSDDVLVSRTTQACADHVRHISESAAYGLDLQAARIARGEDTPIVRRLAEWNEHD